MTNNFWSKLAKPIWVLAPMEDVTDTVFRQIISKLGKPAVFISEFTNVEGICSKGSEIVSQRLKYDKSERPIVAQLWGIDPKHFYEAATKVAKLGFDGIDINLGCPVRDVVKIGACSAMIGKRDEVAEIIKAVKSGGGGLPVSVKTRIGIKKIITEEWFEFLLGQGLSEITVHGRTAAEMSGAAAHWDEIAKVVELRNQLGVDTVIVGNGDIKSLSEAREKVATFGVDGVMIGRGVLENPWTFNNDQFSKNKKQKIDVLQDHVKLWRVTWGECKNFANFKKYIKMYMRDFEGASDLRAKLMETKNLTELDQVLCTSDLLTADTK